MVSGMRFLETGRPYLLILGLLLAALLLSACGGGGENPTPQPEVSPTVTQTGPIEPIIVSSDLGVGPNRFVIGLWDPGKNASIHNAQLHFRFFKLDREGDQIKETLKFEVDARPVTVQRSFTHSHADGTREEHDAGEIGVYSASVQFDSPGEWGVAVTGIFKGQPLPTLTPVFAVRERSQSIAIGAPAPRSIQLTLSDVKDISELSTAQEPNPEMYRLTIADAVASGKPTIIVFATPGFCVTKLCGPSKEAVDALYERYKGQANFIHVEPYDLEKARSGQALATLPWIVPEWGLQTEPWIFLVDRDGNIATKFEGVVSFEEVEVALGALLASGRKY
jgi:hypothetical protein